MDIRTRSSLIEAAYGRFLLRRSDFRFFADLVVSIENKPDAHDGRPTIRVLNHCDVIGSRDLVGIWLTRDEAHRENYFNGDN